MNLLSLARLPILSTGVPRGSPEVCRVAMCYSGLADGNDTRPQPHQPPPGPGSFGSSIPLPFGPPQGPNRRRTAGGARVLFLCVARSSALIPAEETKEGGEASAAGFRCRIDLRMEEPHMRSAESCAMDGLVVQVRPSIPLSCFTWRRGHAGAWPGLIGSQTFHRANSACLSLSRRCAPCRTWLGKLGYPKMAVRPVDKFGSCASRNLEQSPRGSTRPG